jgi:hypothetical protein
MITAQTRSADVTRENQRIMLYFSGVSWCITPMK